MSAKGHEETSPPNHILRPLLSRGSAFSRRLGNVSQFGGWVDVTDGKTNEDASHISKVGTSPFGSLSYFDALAILRSRWPVS